jgi:hypothetical protein
MTARSTFSTALGTCVAATLLDPTRIVVTALLLRKARHECPELFDGHKAAASVNAALAEEAS